MPRKRTGITSTARTFVPMSPPPPPSERGNADESIYKSFLARVRGRLLANLRVHGALFTTDAAGLWEAYLDSFPNHMRQFHACNACRHFIERFGGLVTIEGKGLTAPAIWHLDDTDADHERAIDVMTKIVRRAKVTGVFLTSEAVLGQPKTGAWIHLNVAVPREHLYQATTLTADQAMAEKSEDYRNVQRALTEFPLPLCSQALALLQSEALYRSEKVLGPAQWLADLHLARTAVPGKTRRDNLVWRAVATAPAGFCHPRSSMVGTLLEDLAAGLPFAEVSRRFGEKMNPRQYQRPQAPPKAGNIVQAEKIVEQLRAAGALERRFARVEELDALWRPELPSLLQAPAGVFGHLSARPGFGPAPMPIPMPPMTWTKFERTLLPLARSIELAVPYTGNFAAILTAVNPDAPPIFQWDGASGRRNPFSWYVYPGGSGASQWGLQYGIWQPVTAITLQPSSWYGATMAHHGESVFFILRGAVDRATRGGAGIFPEMLRSELHGVRATIEAYSRAATLNGRTFASACGLRMQKDARDSIGLRVTNRTGGVHVVTLDRWE